MTSTPPLGVEQSSPHPLTGDIVENQAREEKNSNNDRALESAVESPFDSEERLATERFRDEFNAESKSSRTSSEIAEQASNGTPEQHSGQPQFLTFDNSIFGQSKENSKVSATQRIETPQIHAQPTAESTSTDSHGNLTHVDAQGNTTVTSFDGSVVTYTGADGRGFVRIHTDRGWTQTNFGSSPQDNYSIERTYGTDGSYSERYTYADSTRNHTRDVDSEGRVVVTDATGLRIRLTGGSPEFQERALNQILDTPLADRQRLQRLGATIHIVDQPRDVTEAARRIPPGAQGFYDHAGSRAIIIGEYNARGVRETDPEQQTRHEIGHALDHSFGSPFSRTALSADSNYLRDLLDEDAANLSDLWMVVYESYLAPQNPFRNGRAELFADLYAAIRSPIPTERHLQLLRHFPRLVAQIRTMLGGR